MIERFPVCTADDVIRVARKHGFVLTGQKSSYQKWRHPDGRMVIVAQNGSKRIPIGTPKSIIQGAKLSPDDFR